MPGVKQLIVGADGGIGKALAAALRARGRTPLLTTRRPASPNTGSPEPLHLDLAGDLRFWSPPEDTNAAFLCAAVTATDTCRQNVAQTRLVNVENTVLVAERLVRRGAFVIFLSTNLVFDGSVPCCDASAPVRPRTEYGRQKAEAEARLLALGPSVAVVRLSKVITPVFPLFLNWSAALAQGRPVAPFLDMGLSPVPMAALLPVLLGLGDRRQGGIWQLSATDELSYAQAALQLCRHMGANEALVQPVSWRRACPDLEHVPAHTTLDCSRLAQALSFAPLTAAAALAQCFGEMK